MKKSTKTRKKINSMIVKNNPFYKDLNIKFLKSVLPKYKVSKKEIFSKDEVIEFIEGFQKDQVKYDDFRFIFTALSDKLVSNQRGCFDKIESKMFSMNKDNLKALRELKKVKNEFTNKIQSLEESLLYLLHNIKKNQYLYAHYPDYWVKDYLCVKHGVEWENEYMNQLICKPDVQTETSSSTKLIDENLVKYKA